MLLLFHPWWMVPVRYRHIFPTISTFRLCSLKTVLNTAVRVIVWNLIQMVWFLGPAWAPPTTEGASEFFPPSTRPRAVGRALPLSLCSLHVSCVGFHAALWMRLAKGPSICYSFFLEHPRTSSPTHIRYLATFRFLLKYYLNKPFPYLIFSSCSPRPSHTHFPSSCPAWFFSTAQYYSLTHHILYFYAHVLWSSP